MPKPNRIPALTLALVVPVLLCAAPANAGVTSSSYTDKELSADIITAVVPFATFWIAHDKDDSKGEGQFLRSVGGSLVVNSVLRLGFNQTSWGERPNGSPYGFPSGHVAFMTSSAAFLQDRYGWQYGVPAYALTGYVAWVRVDTGHHRWRDVVAGAAVSWSVSRLFVTRFDAPQITPIVGPSYFALRWERRF